MNTRKPKGREEGGKGVSHVLPRDEDQQAGQRWRDGAGVFRYLTIQNKCKLRGHCQVLWEYLVYFTAGH